MSGTIFNNKKEAPKKLPGQIKKELQRTWLIKTVIALFVTNFLTFLMSSPKSESEVKANIENFIPEGYTALHIQATTPLTAPKEKPTPVSIYDHHHNKLISRAYLTKIISTQASSSFGANTQEKMLEIYLPQEKLTYGPTLLAQKTYVLPFSQSVKKSVEDSPTTTPRRNYEIRF